MFLQFNSEANNQDIVSFSRKLCKASAVSLPLIDITLYANAGAKKIWSWIHEAFGGWAFDDSNQTDFPEATTALVSGQVDYSLPTDAVFIKGVSVKNTGGSWEELTPITLEQIQARGFSEAQFLNTASQPIYYRLLSNSVKLYPAPNYSQAASLKIWEDREILLFTTTDTTKTPGWATAYHEALPVYIALQHADINTLPQAKKLQERWDGNKAVTGVVGGYEKMIKSDYSRRFAQLFPARITVGDALAEYQ